MPGPRFAPPRPAALLLLIVALLLALSSIGVRKLANPDEGRYAEISREMAVSGDWVTPRLNGLKYFEKPPMQYWATAAAFEAFGFNEFSARLWTALCCIGCVALVAYAGRRLFSAEVGALAALALAGSPYFLALGEIVTLDMGLTFFTTASVCAFLLALHRAQDPARQRRWMLVAWAAMAGAVLSKGLVGILFPAAVLFIHCAVHRDFSVLKKMHWGWGLAVFFAICTPWFVLVSERNPEFARFFFIHEHFERFLTTEHRREQPWWYFTPILFGGALPWAFLLLPAVRKAWRAESGLTGFRPLRFSVIWTFFVLIFFSASGSKLPAYLLPVFPPLAFVIGYYLHQTPLRRLAWYVLPVVALGMLGAYFAWRAPLGIGNDAKRALYAAYSGWVMAAALVGAAGTLAAFVLFRRNRRMSAAAAIAAAGILQIGIANLGFEATASPQQSAYALAQALKPLLKPDTPVYMVKYYDQSLPFYLGRTVTLVDYYDEFQLGIDSEPDKVVRKVADFPALWMRRPDALAIMSDDTYKALSAQGVPMQIIHQDPRRLAVGKPQGKPST